MNPESRELFRKSILSVLDGNASERFGLTLRGLKTFLPMHGFPEAGGDELLKELSYLEDKGFVARIGKQVSPENTCWRITAEGRDFLALNG